jgi:hypothetical protein
VTLSNEKNGKSKNKAEYPEFSEENKIKKKTPEISCKKPAQNDIQIQGKKDKKRN